MNEMEDKTYICNPCAEDMYLGHSQGTVQPNHSHLLAITIQIVVLKRSSLNILGLYVNIHKDCRCLYFTSRNKKGVTNSKSTNKYLQFFFGQYLPVKEHHFNFLLFFFFTLSFFHLHILMLTKILLFLMSQSHTVPIALGGIGVKQHFYLHKVQHD